MVVYGNFEPGNGYSVIELLTFDLHASDVIRIELEKVYWLFFSFFFFKNDQLLVPVGILYTYMAYVTDVLRVCIPHTNMLFHGKIIYFKQVIGWGNMA